MIKYLFGDTSEYKEVYDVAVALIKLGINTMPPINTQLKFLEEKPNSINQQMPSDMIAYHCMKLRAASVRSTQVEFKTPRIKSKPNVAMSAANQSQRLQDSDGETESEEELDEDFDIMKLMLNGIQYSINKKDETEAHIFQRLKGAALKLTLEQLHAL
jgi:hypothetical protein